METNISLIELRQVVKVYDTPAGGFTALKNVDLQVNAGEFVAVIGKSGSGKSTLINMITGIDRPTLGEVTVSGRPIHNLSEDQIAEWRGLNMGVIFQFFQLLPTLTVIENVMLPMELRRTYPPAERRERAMHLLEQVELAEQAHKFPSAISGGQQQRVAIARALANDPDVIVGDEPTGSLDSKTSDAIFSLFENFVAQGKTILIVTHDRELAGRIPRVVYIADGEITDQHLASALPTLARTELAKVSAQLEPSKFMPGDVIIRQGDEADGFYIIVKGEVEVVLQHATGAAVTVGHLKEGQYFGEIGLLEGGTRTATVKAVTEVTVMRLERDDFADLVAGSDLTREEIARLIRQRVMGQHLSEALPTLTNEELERLMAQINLAEYDSGERIEVSQGTLAIVVEGRAYIDDTGREIIPGQVCGRHAARGELQAAEPTVIMTLPYDAITGFDVTEEGIAQTLTRRYLESALGEFVPNLQRRKRNIDPDL